MKNTREIALEYRMGHWAGIMRDRAESGLSIRKYCEREGMHPNRYHYWQRRLRIAAAAEVQAKKEEVAKMPPAGWMQISAAEEVSEHKNPENDGVMIEIGKSRVMVNETTGTEILKKVCKVLVELC